MSKKCYRSEHASHVIHPPVEKRRDGDLVSEGFKFSVVRFTPRYETQHRPDEPPKRYGYFETEDAQQQALIEAHIKKGAKIREINPSEEAAKEQLQVMLGGTDPQVSAQEILQAVAAKKGGVNMPTTVSAGPRGNSH